MNDMEEELINFGLSQNQSALYIALLKNPESTASALSKATSINRSTVYQELGILIQKGLASSLVKNGKRHYNAAPAEKLVEMLDTKKSQVKKLIPKLRALQAAVIIPAFQTEVYEGKEGIKTFYQHILNTRPAEVVAFGVTGMAFEVLQYSFPQFVKKYARAGIKARYIANVNSRKRLQRLPKSSVRIKYLQKDFHSDVTTIIYDDFVAIQSLVKDDIHVIVIKDKNLAKGYGNYFEFMWQCAPK